LNFIKEDGIEKFIKKQRKRVRLLETMIENFDDGRSRSFFCNAAALLDLTNIENSLVNSKQKLKTNNIKLGDRKNRAKILREIIDEVAHRGRVELSVRRR
jgi:hypothetical protein